MRNLFALLISIFTVVISPAKVQTESNNEILVSAAASLKDVFTELGADFEKKNQIKVSFNFAASGQLKAQIENGAPADVYAAASLADMDALENKKILTENTEIVFARNSLVLVQSINSKIQITTIDDLKKVEVKKIAIGNPDTVPAGRYAKESLTQFKVLAALKEKLVFGESVRQVLDYASKNEVDAGFVYLTDVLTDKSLRKILEIPENSHKAIVYPIAVIKTSQNEDIAKEFVKFVTSKSSEEVFKKYGFK